MNSYKDLTAHVANAQGISKAQARRNIDAVLSSIRELADPGLSLLNYGKFEIRTRAARSIKAPANGLTYDIPANKNLAFKPSRKTQTLA